MEKRRFKVIFYKDSKQLPMEVQADAYACDDKNGLCFYNFLEDGGEDYFHAYFAPGSWLCVLAEEKQQE